MQICQNSLELRNVVQKGPQRSERFLTSTKKIIGGSKSTHTVEHLPLKHEKGHFCEIALYMFLSVILTRVLATVSM